jgi:succinyl-CoA synthetase beta subunit
MWLLPEQLAAVLGEHGVPVDPEAAGSVLRLRLAVESSSGTIRLEARDEADAAAADGGGAVEVDVRYGFWESHVRDLLAGPALRPFAGAGGAATIGRLWAAFCAYEMLALEVSLAAAGPEPRCRGGRAFVDDNALFRNERAARLLAPFASEPAQVLRAHGIEYVELDGTVGLLSVGAGETMAVMDLLDAAGCRAACFLDVSGGFGVEAVTAALRQIASLPRARAVLVNVFGGLTRVDAVAESILGALDRLPAFALPLVVRLEGTQAERGRALVEARGLESRAVLREAVERAAALGREEAA